MSPTTRSRLRQILLYHPTDSAELLCAALLTLRGTWLLNPWAILDTPTTLPLVPADFSPAQWGLTLLLLGVMQLQAAGARMPNLRGNLASLIAFLEAVSLLAYLRAGPVFSQRGVVSTILGIMIIEFWIACRALHDGGLAGKMLDRRMPASSGSL